MIVRDPWPITYSQSREAEIVSQLPVLLYIDDFVTRCAGGLNRLLPVKLREDVVQNNMASCTVERERWVLLNFL